jgi:hypothetical protein
MSVQELEVAITQLPPQELTKLTACLIGYHAKVWHQEIEADLEAGRLDRIYGI